LEPGYSSIGTLATLGGVGIACYALTEWKRIRQADLAEEIIDHATTLIGIIHWARFPGRADAETLFGSHGDVQKNANVVAERLLNREKDLKRTFGLARRAERHLKADGKAIHDDLVALYPVAQDVHNATLALTLRGRDRTTWSEKGDDALGVEADCLAKSIETRIKQWL
jgi:hypothetical protein